MTGTEPPDTQFEQLAADVLRLEPTPRGLDLNAPTWIYGPGGFGRAVAGALIMLGVPVRGFIATNPGANQVMGLPVVAARDSRPGDGAQIVVGLYSRETPYEEIARLCKGFGLKSARYPFEFYPQLREQLGWRYWLGAAGEIQRHIVELGAAYAVLTDDVSREVFCRIIRFRLGLDMDYSGYISPEPQYYNELTLSVLPTEGIRFVDCGAFDGDSFRDFAAVRTLGAAYLFEPEGENYRKLVAGIRPKDATVTCLPLAVSDRHQILSFSGAGESATTAGGSSGASVAAVALDEAFPAAPIDFIKLDIEGAEASALKGARNLIARCRPVIAVSLYHKQNDIWELPLLLKSLTEDYDMFIRQHMYNTFNSVLYGVPQRR